MSLNLNTNQSSFFLIAGPCVIDSQDLCMFIAQSAKYVCQNLDIPLVFKASFDKANRTSGTAFRGLGMIKGLEILAEIKSKTGLPVLTDIHEPAQAALAAEVCDIIQIPAFLCRQTDLIEAAAKTKKIVNIKKGQFLSPGATKHIVNKVKQISPTSKVFLTERGVSFGYGDLLVDMRSFPIMKNWADAVIYDATHSLQMPSQGADKTGGQAEHIATLARAAIATNAVDGIFLEVHPEPSKSPSDAHNILGLNKLEPLLIELLAIKKCLSNNKSS